MEEVTIVGFGIVTLVVLIMELLKRIFPELQDGKAIVVTVAVALLLSYAAALIQLYPAFAQWFAPLILGLVAAASAAGLYSWGKRRQP